ncbi:MAG: hypothetical protein ACI9H6_000092 [Patiriisocius sp.]|jgi:uncharacterized protein YerC
MTTPKDSNTLALKAFNQANTNTSESSLVNLLTTKEKIMLGRRILIAQAILEGKTRYEINNHLSVSPNTFTQIKRWLETEFTTYNSAHLPKESPTPSTFTPLQPLTYKHLKRAYPSHFLLFSLVEELFSLKSKK